MWDLVDFWSTKVPSEKETWPSKYCFHNAFLINLSTYSISSKDASNIRAGGASDQTNSLLVNRWGSLLQTTKYFKYKKHLKTILHDWWSLLTSTGWLPDVNKDETSVNIHASNIMVIALDYKTKTQLITVVLVRGILRPTVKDMWILTFLFYLFIIYLALNNHSGLCSWRMLEAKGPAIVQRKP